MLALLTGATAPVAMDDLCSATGMSIPRMNEVLCRLLLDGKTATVKAKRHGKGRLVTHYTLKTRIER